MVIWPCNKVFFVGNGGLPFALFPLSLYEAMPPSGSGRNELAARS